LKEINVELTKFYKEAKAQKNEEEQRKLLEAQ